MTTVALLLSVMAAYAGGNVTINVTPANAGGVESSISGNVCTLTVTPASGYCMTAARLKAVKIIDAGKAQAPRRAPGIDGENITITPTNANADASGVTTYTFNMPSEEYDVEVTATFSQRVSISDATLTLSETEFVYDGTAKKPTVTVTLDNTNLDAANYIVSYKDSINAGTATVEVTGSGVYMGVASTNYTISKATPTLTVSDSNLRLDVYQSDATYNNTVTVALNGQPIEGEFSFTYESSNERVATVSETGVVQPVGVGEATITVNGPIDHQNFNATTVTYQVTVYTTYGLTVNTVVVNSDNRNDILEDGTVKFDGSHTLVLNNAHLTGDCAEFIGVNSTGLTIYLIGDNSIEGTGVSIRNFNDNGTLIFTTNGNTPGKLTLKNTAAGDQHPVISGFTEVLYEQNLAVLSGDVAQSEAAIGTPIKPIVDETGEEQTVVVTEDVTPSTDLSNVTVGNVLYTLDEDHGDGYDAGTGTGSYIVLGSTMADENVDATVNNYNPGTDEFAENFSGLTFMVPAGTGKIIINAKTGADGVLNVKVGTAEPYEATGAEDFQDFEFPYACTAATYVYVYNASAVTGSSSARRRAGKKTTTTIGIRSLGVSASETQSSNPTPSMEDENSSESPASELTDDYYAGQPFSASIDLRESGLTGVTVSRTEGIFNGVSPNTFIFVPAGNTAGEDEPNVIIGSVCTKAVLDANMPAGESFSPVAAFTAQHIALNRTFAKDESSTVYLPFALSAKAAAELGTFYTFDRAAADAVKIIEVTTGIAAHTPYLFKAKDDATQLAAKVAQVTPKAPAAAPAPRRAPEGDGDADGLYGCYEQYTVSTDADMFRLVMDGGEVRFVRMVNGDVLKPFQAYLRLNGISGDELVVTDSEDVMTGIRTVKPAADQDAGTWQTLDGLRLTAKPAAKGVYIHQGRKVVVK